MVPHSRLALLAVETLAETGMCGATAAAAEMAGVMTTVVAGHLQT